LPLVMVRLKKTPANSAVNVVNALLLLLAAKNGATPHAVAHH